jgi:hypothetical protein
MGKTMTHFRQLQAFSQAFLNRFFDVILDNMGVAIPSKISL